MAPIVAAMTLGRSGGRRLGRRTRNDGGPRASRATSLGTGPWRIMPERPSRQSSAVSSSTTSCRLRPSPGDLELRGWTSWRPLPEPRSSSFLNTAIASGVLALRTGQSISSVIGGDYRETAFNNLALAPLGWLMAIVYCAAVVGHAAVRAAAVHDSDGVAAVRRDARHVHADDRGAGRGRRQARSVHGSAQPASEGDRSRHRAGDAGQRSRNSRRSSGVASSTTSARSGSPTRSC